MHDPLIMICDVPYPWYRKKSKPWRQKYKTWEDIPETKRHKHNKFSPDGYRASFITLWHVDPETDGTDDSCGYTIPRLTREEIDKIKSIRKEETDYVFEYTDGSYYRSKFSVLQGVYCIVELLAWRVWRKSIQPKHIPEIFSASCNIVDNFQHFFESQLLEGDLDRLFILLGRFFKRIDRPWYKHPKYHINHWHFQIHPLQHFKRWAFSRCCKCGKGFKWNESPMSAGYDNVGPKWFKSETNIYHYDCSSYKNSTPQQVTVKEN